MALKRRCPDFGLLHHSDQGCTYASEDYQDLLDARGIVCSMSRRGNCYDNAVMESFFLDGQERARRPVRQSRPTRRWNCSITIEVFYNPTAPAFDDRPASVRRPSNGEHRWLK